MKIEVSTPMPWADAERTAEMLNRRKDEAVLLMSWHGACFYPRILAACPISSRDRGEGLDAMSVVVEVGDRQLLRLVAGSIGHVLWCDLVPLRLKRILRPFIA